MTSPVRPVIDPVVIRRQNELFDLYNQWPGDDPNDDPEFVAAARQVMGLPPLTSEGEASRAAGHDVTPGHDQLHHWWVYGEGRSRWETWTELYDQLAAIPEIGPVKAKAYAGEWFKERHGYAAGSDKNRVAHGKPPRGEHVGPG